MSNDISGPQDPTPPLWYNKKKAILIRLASLTILGTWVFVIVFPYLPATHMYQQYPYFMPAGFVYYFTLIVCATEIFSQIFAILGAAFPSRVCLLICIVPSILLIFAWFILTFEILFGMAFLFVSLVRCFLAASLLIDMIKFKRNRNSDSYELRQF